jgi:2-C-methyl-D-erythritol 4-phosphate cytidylyltransferase
MSKHYAIIVAGGSGSRMNSETPKQFLLLANKPIILHTLEKFLAINDLNIILVLPKSSFAQWENIKKEFKFDNNRITVANGGATRFQSVKSGLANITEKNTIIAIHDAVRPFVSVADIELSLVLAEKHKAVVLAVEPKDSVRIIDAENQNSAIDRTKLRLVQTPQTFNGQLLQKAYLQTEESWFTDDASVVENLGNKIFIKLGSYQNIKITTPEDLFVAEQILINFK